ncbi:Beta-glucosidase [Leucobacter sp. 7(1)]|uniref:Beta-glucosidase n=1 Tax=Microbacterium esteraromaticum TaxID=57043 RepID=A0A1R4KAQ0_9MICO|nr:MULTISPECIES: glycoside hydrolase family 3 C-terminal domain-containing protein [Microbacteriaceae]SJN10367.1 Beta-glucosidase [Leucobacter sp. 7(1)]SJN41083.1 Beta-glucosidase [Microbacterium esteraromaticum]
MEMNAGRRAARAQYGRRAGRRAASTDTMTTEGNAYGEAVRAVRAGELDADEAADQLIDQMTVEEVLGLLDGDSPRLLLPLIPILHGRRPFVAGAVSRLGIPGIRFSDGARGVVIGACTAFPVTIARAATWDPLLEERVGLAIGLETRARGANYSASVCVNLLRHPAWGRAQECYGEDPVLTGRMGSALTRGVRVHAMACVKHFALNSMENERFEVDVSVDEHALHEVYLPHFKAVLEAGADSVMSSYNRVRGEYMDVNRALLTDVLRNEWGFSGFVTSDWVFGTHDAVVSLQAGMDVEMPLRLLRARDLPTALRRGDVARATVLRSARRILRTGVLHAATREVARPSAALIASPAHRALARQVAEESIVLLKNETSGAAPLLPLAPTIRHLAVIGRLAPRANLGDHGSSRVRPPSAVSPLRGLREALPSVRITTASGTNERAAAAVAAAAETAIVVVGLDQHDEGESVVTGGVDVGVLGREFGSGFLRRPLIGLAHLASRFVRGGDRSSLNLRPSDVRLIRTVVAANPRTIVVLIGGSAILTEAWRDRVPALLLAWYGGMEGGRALANVLTGGAEPGGRLPFVLPTDAAHLPSFDRAAKSVIYDDKWGQRRLDGEGHAPAFPFGFGLGYTTIEHRLLDHRFDDSGGSADVLVTNTGDREGSTVVQIYAADVSIRRPVAQLLGFQKVKLQPGVETTVRITLDAGPTLQRDPATRRWSTRAGDWAVLAAQHSPASWADARQLRHAEKSIDEESASDGRPT